VVGKGPFCLGWRLQLEDSEDEITPFKGSWKNREGIIAKSKPFLPARLEPSPVGGTQSSTGQPQGPCSLRTEINPAILGKLLNQGHLA
jgi:hypothetical protein